LSKFFEAMQRAANSPDEPSSTSDSGKQQSALPNLDEALLKPEGPEMDDVFPEVSEAEAPVPSEARQRTNSADHHEAYIREVAVSPPAESVPGVHTPSGGTRTLADEPSAVTHPFSTAPLVDTGVFRSPTYAAYERIIQRLLRYRRTPRQSLILVTSAVVGEGTSTVARNMALALGRHETEQILLVDARCADGGGAVDLGDQGRRCFSYFDHDGRIESPERRTTAHDVGASRDSVGYVIPLRLGDHRRPAINCVPGFCQHRGRLWWRGARDRCREHTIRSCRGSHADPRSNRGRLAWCRLESAAAPHPGIHIQKAVIGGSKC